MSPPEETLKSNQRPFQHVSFLLQVAFFSWKADVIHSFLNAGLSKIFFQNFVLPRPCFWPLTARFYEVVFFPFYDSAMNFCPNSCAFFVFPASSLRVDLLYHSTSQDLIMIPTYPRVGGFYKPYFWKQAIFTQVTSQEELLHYCSQFLFPPPSSL